MKCSSLTSVSSLPVLTVFVFVWQMIPLDSFVGQSADGKMVPIIPGGNSIPLTFSNRKEYVERAIEYRLHEIDRQVQKRPLHTRHVKSMRIFCVLKIFFGLTSSVQQHKLQFSNFLDLNKQI